MYRKIFILISYGLFFFLTMLSVYSINESSSMASIDISKLIPPNQYFYSETSSYGGQVHSYFTYDIKVDKKTGDIQIETHSEDFCFLGHYDRFLRLKDSATTFYNNQVIKIEKHDKRVAFFDKKSENVIIKYYKDNKEINTKVINYDINTVDSEALIIYLQGMLIEGIHNFNGNILLKSKGLKLNVDFKQSNLTDMQQPFPKTVFPLLFKDRLANTEGCFMYDMSFTGIIGLIYPHRFYFLFKNTPFREPISYWGGTSSDEEYFIFNEI